MNVKHYSSLDGVRAIAALMVMLFHFALTLPADSVNPLLIKISWFKNKISVNLVYKHWAGFYNNSTYFFITNRGAFTTFNFRYFIFINSFISFYNIE
ncbi:MAG: hypothetical protein EOO43_14985 [Flavobacterium sp.]|nr:MAG: hypothetical protein EOO43_14985 [Flavobacterium sp.]